MTITVYTFSEVPVTCSEIESLQTEDDGETLVVSSANGIDTFEISDIDIIKFEEGKK